MTKKPTLELNPITETVAEADAPVSNVVIDSKGRALKIESPDVLTESRLVRLVGQDAALNSAYMGGYVVPAVSVVAIDGEEMPFPMTQREIDASIQRLGEAGIRAVIMHMNEKRERDEAKDAVKN